MAKFKLSSTENTNFNTPQQMFDDYKNRTIDSIFNYQSDMIELYLKEAKDVKDIALELPTGTGKTLIGLLIGEFRRRKNKEKILYQLLLIAVYLIAIHFLLTQTSLFLMMLILEKATSHQIGQ